MYKLLDLNRDYDKKELEEAGEFIRDGKLVLFPTETVYGIGADAFNKEAILNIFKAKNRPADDPLIVHVSSSEMVKRVAKEVSEIEQKIMDKFFPGPLTIVFPKVDSIPYETTGGLDTVGVRMPENKIAHDLIEVSDTPIAAPSANISGRPSGTNIKDIYLELADKMDYIIDGGDTKIGVESTVIRVLDGVIHILRPGKITEKDLEKIAPVVIDSHVLGNVKEGEKLLSPGMKYRHYAPNSKCLLIYSDDENKLIDEMKKYAKGSTLVVCKTSHLKYFENTIDFGNTLEEISHNVFRILREVDDKNVDLVIIEGVKSEGLGLAIMNRLIRACSHNYIEI